MPTPRRIALVSQTPSDADERVLNTLAPALVRRGAIVERVTGFSRAGQRAGGGPGIIEVGLGLLPLSRPNEWSLRLSATRRLLRRWGACRPDLVHLGAKGSLAWAALRAARQLSIPVVLDNRVDGPQARSRPFATSWGPRISGRGNKLQALCDATLVATRSGAAQVTSRGFAQPRVVGHGIDPRLFHPSKRDRSLRERWGAYDEQRVALYVGPLTSDSGARLALETARLMRLRDPHLKMIVVGDGPERKALTREFSEYRFLGSLFSERLAATYASSDLLLFPRRDGAEQSVLAEAMASGIACVAFDQAPTRELIDPGLSGILARETSDEAFARAAGQLAGKQQAIEALGRAARRRAELCPLDAVTNAIETAYVLAQGSAAQRLLEQQSPSLEGRLAPPGSVAY